MANRTEGMKLVSVNVECMMQADTRAVRCVGSDSLGKPIHTRADPVAFYVPVTVRHFHLDAKGKAEFVTVDIGPSQTMTFPIACCTFCDGAMETPKGLRKYLRA